MFSQVIMSFKSKKFYAICFIACLILAVTVKLLRHSYSGTNEFSDILLGSSPSFLYLFGLISIVPVVKVDIQLSSYIKTAFMLTLGALAYEAEQSWRTFDFYDVIATISAFLIFLAIHHFKLLKT